MLPDAAWLRHEIPIAEVAKNLGLEGEASGCKFNCWRDHRPGERKRTLSTHAKSNTIRCFKCDSRNLSTIDLVAAILDLSVGEAMKYLAANFPGAPRRELRIKAEHAHHAQSRKSVMTLQDIICSRGWSSLSQRGKVLLTAICARSPQAGPEQFTLRCTYEHLARWTGITGRATIAAALRELTDRGVIQRELVRTQIRTRRGFWLKQLRVRAFPHSLRYARAALPASQGSATGYSVQNLNSQYAVQNLNSQHEIQVEVEV